MYEKLSKCPLCQGGHFSNFMVVKDHAVSQESFSISKCANCSFLFTNPRPDPENIARYYDSKDYISHQNTASNITNLIYKLVRKYTIRQKVEWINEQDKNKGKLLDFGCGTGYFLKAAEKNGWEVVGLEPSAHASTIAKKQNLTVYQHAAELVNEKKFDVITLFHVLEHVHDLNKTMDMLLSRLKKRGTLLVAVPIFDSYDAAHYKENWASLDVPRHLYHFTRQTMEKLAQLHGLKIKSTYPMLFDSYYVSILSEGYIKSRNRIINALKVGYKSNKTAKRENSYSSLLFVLKKV